MIARPDIEALLAGELGQWLASQGGARAEAKAKAARIQRYAIGAACVVAFLYILFKPSDIVGGLQFGFFVGMAGFGWAALSSGPVVARIKGGINGAIAKALELEYSANVTPGKAFERAKAFGLVPSYDNERSRTFGGARWAPSPSRSTKRSSQKRADQARTAAR